MRLKFTIRTAGIAVLCLAAAAFAGLPWADASSHAATAPKAAPASAGKLCGVRSDGDDSPGCLGHGPRGKRGPQGSVGPLGAPGTIGPVGNVGPAGPVGPKGPTGDRGIIGKQGPKGLPGDFAPGAPFAGGHTVVVLGTKIGPVTITSNAPAKGMELGPSVAECPATPQHGQAFDGGAIITTVNPNLPVGSPTGDVVGLESSFPGRDNGTSEVDPIAPVTPGTVLPQPANAYSATAVVTRMNSGDNVTVQAYVVCGP